mgnify:CR=1 FL=1
MRPLVFALSTMLVLAGLVSACSDDDPVASSADAGSDGATDAGRTTEAGHDGHDSGAVDPGPRPIRCTDEELAENDMTDGGALVVTFLKTANPKQYENRCATVKVGASVTFTGSFTQHPLQAAGGDLPNPIPYTAEDQPDDKLVVTMTTPGSFGYECEFHPTLMFGAIRVVP